MFVILLPIDVSRLKATLKSSDDDNSNDKDDDAKYPVSFDNTSDEQKSSTVTLIIAVASLTVLSLGVLIWQYRKEIGRFWQRLRNKTKPNKKDSPAKVKLAKPEDEISPSDWMDKLTK